MVAFLAVGFIPLFAFVIQFFLSAEVTRPYGLSCLLTAAALLTLSAIRSRFVEQAWHWSALETLALGGAASSLAYAVGALLGGNRSVGRAALIRFLLAV